MVLWASHKRGLWSSGSPWGLREERLNSSSQRPRHVNTSQYRFEDRIGIEAITREQQHATNHNSISSISN